MRSALKEFAHRQLRRVGLDLIRYPSSRLRSGHTVLVIEHMDIDVVVDVGANTGQYGEFLRSIGFRGPIVSFEPVSRVAAELEEVAAKDGNWRVERVALGSAADEATINITRAPVMSSLRAPSTGSRSNVGADIEVVATEVVPVRRLDAVLDDCVSPGANVFLKLAVQGWDLEVLAGAAGCMSRIKAIQSIVSVVPLYEGMPTWLESLQYMRDLGFTPTGMFPVLHYDTLHVAEFDVVMVRPLGTE